MLSCSATLIQKHLICDRLESNNYPRRCLVRGFQPPSTIRHRSLTYLTRSGRELEGVTATMTRKKRPENKTRDRCNVPLGMIIIHWTRLMILLNTPRLSSPYTRGMSLAINVLQRWIAGCCSVDYTKPRALWLFTKAHKPPKLTSIIGTNCRYG